jgi:hypothetical protein
MNILGIGMLLDVTLRNDVVIFTTVRSHGEHAKLPIVYGHTRVSPFLSIDWANRPKILGIHGTTYTSTLSIYAITYLCRRSTIIRLQGLLDS